MMIEGRNVLGGRLETCSHQPLTGFYRDGCCNTGMDDVGVHVVCAKLTQAFLDFSKAQGNDLTTPGPGFPGLKPGDCWCLCASRWKAACEAGVAPAIYLNATHVAVLEFIPLDTLKAHALDLQ